MSYSSSYGTPPEPVSPQPRQLMARAQLLAQVELALVLLDLHLGGAQWKDISLLQASFFLVKEFFLLAYYV